MREAEEQEKSKRQPATATPDPTEGKSDMSARTMRKCPKPKAFGKQTRHRLDATPSESPPNASLDPPSTGYGHPSHHPDPAANYGFDPQKRVLPDDQAKRWKVSG